MAAPAEVSKKRSNFRIRQFKEKWQYNIAANLTLNTISFIILLIARTARIACADRQTHTHTRDNYCNPRCACALRVNIISTAYNPVIMKALKCKPSAQFAYNYTINFLSKCSNIISHRSSVFEGQHNGTSIILLRRSTHLSSILEGRHIDRRSSKIDTSFFEGRHINHRSSKVDTSIFKDRRQKHCNNNPTSHRHSDTEYCPQRRSIVMDSVWYVY